MKDIRIISHLMMEVMALSPIEDEEQARLDDMGIKVPKSSQVKMTPHRMMLDMNEVQMIYESDLDGVCNIRLKCGMMIYVQHEYDDLRRLVFDEDEIRPGQIINN